MAASVTLAQLRMRSRTLADERPGGHSRYVQDVELNLIINDAIKELYDLLVAARGHEYYIAPDLSITTAIDVEDYALPDDFYEVHSVHIGWSSTEWEPVEQFELGRDESELRRFASWGRWSRKGFRIMGDRINFLPPPKTAQQVVLRYVPAFTELEKDSDEFDGVNGWDLLVQLDAAIAMRTMSQRETGDLAQRRERTYERIQGLAADRAAKEPKTVQDVSPECGWNRWPERLPRP